MEPASALRARRPGMLPRSVLVALFNNPHTRYVDMAHNGYLLVDIDAWRARAGWYHLADVLNPDTSETVAAAVEVADGSRHAVMVERHHCRRRAERRECSRKAWDGQGYRAGRQALRMNSLIVQAGYALPAPCFPALPVLQVCGTASAGCGRL
jgi:hypothetical protein